MTGGVYKHEPQRPIEDQREKEQEPHAAPSAHKHEAAHEAEKNDASTNHRSMAFTTN